MSILPATGRKLRILTICYLDSGALHVEKMGRGFAWLDTGSKLVQTLEKRQGMKIACPEEIAYRMGLIGRAQLLKLAEAMNKSGFLLVVYDFAAVVATIRVEHLR